MCILHIDFYCQMYTDFYCQILLLIHAATPVTTSTPATPLTTGNKTVGNGKFRHS